MTAPSITSSDPSRSQEPAAHDAPGHVRRDRAGIGRMTAEQVEVHVGGVGAARADDVFVQWGGIGATRADSVGVEFGAVGAALAREVRVTQGFAGSVVAREATLEQALSRTVVAQRVAINRPSAIGILIAQHVEGDVRPLLDWRGALAAGTALAVAAAIRMVIRGGGEQTGRPRLGFGQRR